MALVIGLYVSEQGTAASSLKSDSSRNLQQSPPHTGKEGGYPHSQAGAVPKRR